MGQLSVEGVAVCAVFEVWGPGGGMAGEWTGLSCLSNRYLDSLFPLSPPYLPLFFSVSSPSFGATPPPRSFVHRTPVYVSDEDVVPPHLGTLHRCGLATRDRGRNRSTPTVDRESSRVRGPSPTRCSFTFTSVSGDTHRRSRDRTPDVPLRTRVYVATIVGCSFPRVDWVPEGRAGTPTPPAVVLVSSSHAPNLPLSSRLRRLRTPSLLKPSVNPPSSLQFRKTSFFFCLL